MNPFHLRVEKRVQVSWQRLLGFTLLAILGGLVVAAILMGTAGVSITESLVALFGGGFGSLRSILETLVKTTPLLLTALAATLAFRGQVWNIGAEGQLFSGAMLAYWAYTVFQDLPPALLFIVVVLAGFLGGAICGGVAGLLKAKFNVDVIISTVMLNYVVQYLVSLMLSDVGPWRDPRSFYPHSRSIAASAQWPILIERYRLHIGFILALLAALVVFLILEKSVLGYKVRAMGSNLVASEFKGIRTTRILLLVMMMSGGIAGLAGASELFGVQYRLRPDLSPGYGFTGIIVAMLGGLNPFGVLVASIFFGGLINGAVRMQIVTNVPVALVDVVQAVLLLFLLVAQVMARYRFYRVEQQPALQKEITT